MKLSSEHSDIQMLFKTQDYGGNKGKDWRIYILIPKLFIQAASESYSEFDKRGKIDSGAYVPVEKCFYGLTLKDLERLEKWIERAKKKLTKG